MSHGVTHNVDFKLTTTGEWGLAVTGEVFGPIDFKLAVDQKFKKIDVVAFVIVIVIRGGPGHDWLDQTFFAKLKIILNRVRNWDFPPSDPLSHGRDSSLTAPTK